MDISPSSCYLGCMSLLGQLPMFKKILMHLFFNKVVPTFFTPQSLSVRLQMQPPKQLAPEKQGMAHASILLSQPTSFSQQHRALSTDSLVRPRHDIRTGDGPRHVPCVLESNRKVWSCYVGCWHCNSTQSVVSHTGLSSHPALSKSLSSIHAIRKPKQCHTESLPPHCPC